MANINNVIWTYKVHFITWLKISNIFYVTGLFNSLKTMSKIFSLFVAWLSIVSIAKCDIAGCAQASNATQKRLTLHDFKTDIVHNEFIVKFSGFYNNDARKNYITAALAGFDSGDYEIVERHNPMAEYPSDFDVLLVSDIFGEKAMKALENHPLIKSITPQRKVMRTLQEVEDEEEEHGKRARHHRKLFITYHMTLLSQVMKCMVIIFVEDVYVRTSDEKKKF